ncbi:nipsnap family containing protein [Escherichia coli]|nr:nipsnap family containing protein [Escherichia coli]
MGVDHYCTVRDNWRSGPREDIIGNIEASIKTVINLPSESVEGLRVQS